MGLWYWASFMGIGTEEQCFYLMRNLEFSKIKNWTEGTDNFLMASKESVNTDYRCFGHWFWTRSMGGEKTWSFKAFILGPPGGIRGFPGGSDGKESVCNAGDLGLNPGQEDTLEKQMAAHSSILAWRIPWTEEAGGLQPTGSQRVRHNWVSNAHGAQGAPDMHTESFHQETEDRAERTLGSWSHRQSLLRVVRWQQYARQSSGIKHCLDEMIQSTHRKLSLKVSSVYTSFSEGETRSFILVGFYLEPGKK